MARNRVQFQKGLSEPEFERLYGTEELCRAMVVAARWPSGFECPACGGKAHSLVQTRGLFQCTACRRQTSPTAGTIFASTKLPLRTWFRALYHLTQTKQGLSSLELGRRLGVRQSTAWTVKHKLQQVMMERDATKRLIGRVELDDAYLGGERTGGKRGRGAPGKTAFVAAVETTPQGKPVRLKLRRVASFCGHAISGFAKRSLDPDCEVVSDGLACFGRVTDAGCTHQVIKTGSGAQAVRTPAFTRKARLSAGGQHGAGQHQGRTQRHLSRDQSQARAALPRRVRIQVQPTLRSRRHDPAPCLGHCPDATHALSAPEVG
jgi:ribosomal protein L37AE/L43A